MPDLAFRKAFATRLNHVLDQHGYPLAKQKRYDRFAAEFAPYAVVSARKTLSGHGVPHLPMLLKICDHFSVDPTWLLTGEEKRREIDYLLIGAILEIIDQKDYKNRLALSDRQKTLVAEQYYLEHKAGEAPNPQAILAVMIDNDLLTG